MRLRGNIGAKNERGFGFIADGESTPPDFRVPNRFFHARNCKGVAFEDLDVGDEVTYSAFEGEKGPQATQVEKVEDGEQEFEPASGQRRNQG